MQNIYKDSRDHPEALFIFIHCIIKYDTEISLSKKKERKEKQIQSESENDEQTNYYPQCMYPDSRFLCFIYTSFVFTAYSDDINLLPISM